MSSYNQTRSFNLGIAKDVSVEAALIYNDLAYAQDTFGEGKWFYRSYEQLMNRLPYSERTLRTHIGKLVQTGWIDKKIMKVEGSPIAHYKICRSLSAKVAETIETAKLAETINSNNNTKTIKKSQNRSVDFGGVEAPPGRADPPDVADFLETLIDIVNPKEKVTTDRIRVVKGRLKDYTMSEIVGAAHAFSHSAWHKENKQMSIDNLLAPSKFGRWYQAGQELRVDPQQVAKRRANEQTADEEMAAFRVANGGKA